MEKLCPAGVGRDGPSIDILVVGIGCRAFCAPDEQLCRFFARKLENDVSEWVRVVSRVPLIVLRFQTMNATPVFWKERDYHWSFCGEYPGWNFSCRSVCACGSLCIGIGD